MRERERLRLGGVLGRVLRGDCVCWQWLQCELVVLPVESVLRRRAGGRYRRVREHWRRSRCVLPLGPGLCVGHVHVERMRVHQLQHEHDVLVGKGLLHRGTVLHGRLGDVDAPVLGHTWNVHARMRGRR